jgi:cell division protein FtsI (penicillin-binding protein 3)
MSYGYGLSASLFQMAHSYTAFAHDGEIIPATMLKSDTPAAGREGVLARRRGAVRKMLQMAAGAGRHRARRPRRWATRWAASPARPTSRSARPTPANKYRSWFTGMAPIDKPRIIVGVMIDEPSAASTTAAPWRPRCSARWCSKRLRMMGVQPDMAVKPQIVANAVEESF